MHKRPLNSLWGNTTINSCYLWKEGYIFVWQTPWDICQWCGFFGSGQRIKISLKCRVTIPVKLTCSLCTKKLGQKCRSKANYVVWQVGLISRYFTRTTTDLHALACSRHVPCDQLGYYLFGYGIQSHLHLMNLMVFKSQSPNVSTSCHDAFVDLNQRENTTTIIFVKPIPLGGSHRRAVI